MNLKNILLKFSALKIYKLIPVVAFTLFMTNMVVSSGFAVLMVNADDILSDSYLTATPSSCSVGDTITLAVKNTSPNSKYSYSYVIDGGSVHSLTGFISDDVYYYTPVNSGTYTFRVSILTSSLTTVFSNAVVVSSDESSEPESSEPESSEPESSEPESSEPESSEPESSISLPFLPSDWEGGGFVQPSAESTPDLSYEDLPSDLDAFEVSENLTQIIGKSFNAFPQKLIVLMIPTVICLFIGWWLHK